MLEGHDMGHWNQTDRGQAFKETVPSISCTERQHCTTAAHAHTWGRWCMGSRTRWRQQPSAVRWQLSLSQQAQGPQPCWVLVLTEHGTCSGVPQGRAQLRRSCLQLWV